jgi:Mu-like prophage I protein
MSDKFKKINRQYVLSDSSVNVYGFRLLTSGYQLDAFRKNPIGYYMHRRDDGIALKWDELHIEDDCLIGIPVINLSNERGQQICDEAENGFLNAASVGHIVVLEYSTDPEMMLPGQTGPTITKWYNKECSLVDIPGNCNALTNLYDAQENELNLPDLMTAGHPVTAIRPNLMKDIADALQLPGDASDIQLFDSVQCLIARATTLEAENTLLRSDRQELQQQIAAMHAQQNKYEVAALLYRGLEDKKLTVALRNKLAQDYAGNPEGLKELLAAMPAYRSITEHLKRTQPETEAKWLWDDYEKNDPSGNKLKDLKANDPARYRDLFDKKFAA